MPKRAPKNNQNQNIAEEAPLIKLANFASLTLPLLAIDDDTEVNSSIHQMETVTPSAQLPTSKSTSTHLMASNMAAAEPNTTRHCRECPVPGCLHIFHHVDSSYSFREHMDSFHPIGTDHNERSLCPVRTCEYAVLGFTNLDMCMQHLSVHHDPSKPFADYSTERGTAVAEKPVSKEAKRLCEECFAKKHSPLHDKPSAPRPTHVNEVNMGTPGHVSDSDESCLESEPYKAVSFSDIMNSIATDLLGILGHDLALLARLLPRIHASLQERVCNENTSYGGSDYNPGLDSIGDCGSLASSKTRKSSTSSSLGKHGRDEREQDDDGDNGDDGLPKKPRSKAEPTEIKGPRYACPFHKRFPYIYSTVTGRKYRSCSGPGQTEARRLKEHLQNIHRRVQGGSSSSVPNDPSVHNREPGGGREQSEYTEDKIDDAQWAQIGEILRVRRPNYKSDITKWYELWEVLFPNTRAPTHPFHDHGISIVPQPSHDTELKVSMAQNIISIFADGDGYILDTGSVNYAWKAMQTVLEVEKATARYAPNLSFDIGSSANPFLGTFTMPDVRPRQFEASELPSHVDPAVLSFASSSEQPQSWQPQSSSNNEYNAAVSPGFAIVPQNFPGASEAKTGDQAGPPQSNQHEHGGFQNNLVDISYGPQPSVPGTFQSFDIPATPTSLSINLSAPYTMTWAHNRLFHPEDIIASPGNLNSQQPKTQYTTASNGVFEAGELPELSRRPSSVCELLELELGAAFNKQYQHGKPFAEDDNAEST